MYLKIVIYVGLISILSACNKSDSGPAKSKEELEQIEIQSIKNFKSGIDYSTQIQPFMSKVIKSNLNYSETLKFNTFGCKKEGSIGSSYLIDPLLKVGHVFSKELAYSTINIDKNNEYMDAFESTISKIEENKIEKHKKYSKKLSTRFPFTSISQMFLAIPHEVEQTIFTFKSDGGSPETKHNVIENNYSPEVKNWILRNSNNNADETYLSCSVNTGADSKNLTYSNDLIEFSYNNKIVTGLAYRQKITGLVICKKYKRSKDTSTIQQEPLLTVELGSGFDESLSIFSNDILSDGLTECGGTQIYRSTVSKLTNGKVFFSWVEKTVSAPTR